MQLVATIIGALVGLLAWPSIASQFDGDASITILIVMVVAGGAARGVLALVLAGDDAQAWVRKMRLAHFGDMRGDKILPLLGGLTALFVGYLYVSGVPLPAPTLGLAAMAFAACVKGQPLIDDPWPPAPREFRLRMPDARRAAEELDRLDPAQLRPCTIELVARPDPVDPSRTVTKSFELLIRASQLEGGASELEPFDLAGVAREPEIRALAYAVGRFAAQHHLEVTETANVVVRLVIDPENLADLHDEPEHPRPPIVVLSHKRATDAERAWTAASILAALGMDALLLRLERRGKPARYAVAVPAPRDLGGRSLSVGGTAHLWGAIRPDAPGAFGEPPEATLGDWQVIAGALPNTRAHVIE